MQLYGSTRSPFVRKVLIAAHETGLNGQIELLPKVVSFTKADDEVCSHNPLGQIPTLLLDDGTALWDSGVICDYLGEISGTGWIVPEDRAARREALVRQATADGLMNTYMRWYGERRRSDDPLSATYVANCREKFRRVLGHWEAQAAGWSTEQIDLGFIAIACALAYADFRFGAENWRDGHAALAAWHEAVESRPAFQAAAFRDG
ncbi:glutathione S-transferase [Bosea sp. BK604]|uniref:glutathione S-transferase family protein n=1 Tax=Bosea sp. BK604 TaxID=2512180 RepID=UPI0010454A77|nr:glutathione S-transferase [Bosea sp. BK604]TCR70651.1 glutathione S-transferase [Bosea sp. BK604]